jgi:hemerythrin-like domain-containing protein
MTTTERVEAKKVPTRSRAKRSAGLRTTLMGEHDKLEALFQQLLDASKADSREDVAATWTALERLLESHLAFEEQSVFPGLSRREPREVRGLLHDHREIRALLAELAVEVDLHVVRHARVKALVALLRRHAKREDALAYQWAEAHVKR